MNGFKKANRLEQMSRRYSARRGVVSTVSLLALCFAAETAAAQQADVPPAAPDLAGQPAATAASEDIIVTGSRIVRNGYDAPTPVSVISSIDIQAQAPQNLADFVNMMPAISGSSTPGTSSNSISAGTAGINALNLRSLGTSRTLVLLDGQRSVASAATGVVDINTFPQDLVERVEVVTGGASAAYGSDAVGGVVNFILNKNFKGLKLGAEYGVTTYGDGNNYRLSGTAGFGFLDDKLRILVNAEYFKMPGIHTVDRDWNRDRYFFQIDNPAYVPGNGQPERYIGTGIGPSTLTPGGLITRGPLRGTYFGPIDPATGRATTGTLDYGTVKGPWMIGGDYEYTASNYLGTTSLLPAEERTGIFTRVTYEVTPDIEVYGQFSYNRSEGLNIYIQTPNADNVTIQRDNAFLPDSVRDDMVRLGLQSITIGTTNYGIPPGGGNMTRRVFRYVGGINGKLDLFGRDWSWNAYYQKGVAKAHEQTVGVWQNSRVAAATDAVFAPAGNAAGIAEGTIVCRSTLTDPTNGCVPLNRIGMGGVTQEALDYIFTAEQPYRDQKLTQDVAALTFSGEVFDLPAGPVAIAFGGEWRKEKVDGFVKPEYNSGWLYGNYLVNRGQYTVKEGFIEVAAPLFDGFEVNAAGRYTDYSTSGSVQTWKVGATYSPIPDIKFRGTLSRDIRAPNLDELFAAGTARSNSVNIGGVSMPFVLNATGNPNLKPEVAKSWSVGTVLSPGFIPRLNVAVDYYDIKVEDAIGSLHQQEVADLCYLQGVQEQCANLIFEDVGGQQVLRTIKVSPINFATQKARGLDIEASYQLPLDTIFSGAAGNLVIRGLATHYIENRTDRGFGFPVNTAGTNNSFRGGPPSWTYRVSALVQLDPFSFGLIGRGISSGKYDNSYIECESDCPVSTPEHITINNNRIAGAFYLDTTLGYTFDTGLGDGTGELQFSIRNIFNTDPVPVANGPAGQNVVPNPQASRTFYDLLGRTFRIAARFKF